MVVRQRPVDVPHVKVVLVGDGFSDSTTRFDDRGDLFDRDSPAFDARFAPKPSSFEKIGACRSTILPASSSSRIPVRTELVIEINSW